MDKARVETLVIELLNGLQCLVAEEKVMITSTTVPLVDLGFFDSLLGLEMTVALEGSLGISIEDQTVFTDSETKKPLSIAQIAKGLCETYPGVAA